MKLAKYLVFIVVLIGSVIFIMKLNELNTYDDATTKIMIPGLTGDNSYFKDGMDVWQAMIFSLSLGVLIGFIIALIQIISQKAVIINLKSKSRKLQSELDDIRNQSLDENIDLEDETDKLDDFNDEHSVDEDLEDNA